VAMPAATLSATGKDEHEYPPEISAIKEPATVGTATLTVCRMGELS